MGMRVNQDLKRQLRSPAQIRAAGHSARLASKRYCPRRGKRP